MDNDELADKILSMESEEQDEVLRFISSLISTNQCSQAPRQSVQATSF